MRSAAVANPETYITTSDEAEIGDVNIAADEELKRPIVQFHQGARIAQSILVFTKWNVLNSASLNDLSIHECQHADDQESPAQRVLVKRRSDKTRHSVVQLMPTEKNKRYFHIRCRIGGFWFDILIERDISGQGRWDSGFQTRID